MFLFETGIVYIYKYTIKVFRKKITRLKCQRYALFTETSNGVEYRDDESNIVSLLLVSSSSMYPYQNLSSVFVFTMQILKVNSYYNFLCSFHSQQLPPNKRRTAKDFCLTAR